MKKSVGIWIRVSTEDQAKGESPKHHEERARMYTQLKDWDIKEIYNLEAVSGKSVMNHPEAQRMLSDIKRGHITGLIFSKLARLARNTKELLEFADIFRSHNADLISLQESIDTGSPAGRFFYTTIAAMAQWEREEIADRIKASVPVRAKLGKSLGGEAPYGYKWVNKELVLDEDEAPIRRLMFELFAEVKRKRTVAKMLTERGYRTRRDLQFTDSLVHRCLVDPIAKGLRRTNYTMSLGEGRHWTHKPKDEWVFQQAPAIVPEELWETCNRILGSLTTKDKVVRRKAVHLFSGIVTCVCGNKMYLRTKSPSYVCSKCKNKIKADILEEVFQEQLRSFLFSETELSKHLESEHAQLKEKRELVEVHDKRIKELRVEIKQTLQLYYDGKVDANGFEEYHTPLREELKQNEESRLKLQASVDAISLQSLSNEQVVYDAQDLHSQWNDFTPSEKRIIIDAITDGITVGKEDIEIKLHYIPTLVKPENLQPSKTTAPPLARSLQSGKTMLREHKDSSKRPA